MLVWWRGRLGGVLTLVVCVLVVCCLVHDVSCRHRHRRRHRRQYQQQQQQQREYDRRYNRVDVPPPTTTSSKPDTELTDGM